MSDALRRKFRAPLSLTAATAGDDCIVDKVLLVTGANIGMAMSRPMLYSEEHFLAYMGMMRIFVFIRSSR